ncbi:flagellar basal body protein [Phenylobacterium sp. J367]|uniref:flagellar basal body protein n=1 Tax=Phenylobacterium sp. J367 TaxID=2898435 RepID=UPI002151DDDC|nr:flagellar basal body protein [Phenylobacterium sp. J367]MCR5879931.1 flagellar basal body protein [Phenylobacterium sp. J367]
MALAADTATDRVEQLILLTERLTDLITQECQAFEARRPQDAAANIEECGRLANLYRHESARVKADPRMVQAAPKELRERLVQATRAFDAVLARQGRAIEAAKTVTEGLVRAIAEEVASTRQQASGYGPGATLSGQPASTATAITLNRKA